MNSEETTEDEAADLAEALNAAREALEAAPIELPAVPADAEIKAVGIGTTSLTLMWDAVENADSYRVYAAADGGERTEAGTTEDTWLRVEGLTPGTDYTFEVYAVNNAGESEDAMTTAASTLPEADTEAPSKVEGIRVSEGSAEDEVKILWNASTDESGDAVSYIIYVNGEKKAETDQTEYVLDGVAAGEVYHVRLVAVDANGNKSLASSFHFTLEDVGGPAEPVSKKILEYFLNEAKGFVEDGTVSGLVESIQKMFTDAIAKGEAVMADEDATKDEVIDAAKDLMMAIHALEMKAADKTDLEMALELAEMIDLTKYVEAGQAEYLAAKEAAEAVMADGDAMQAETDEAWNNLVEAMNALRLKADKSVLKI